jgi:hypothetical protein
LKVKSDLSNKLDKTDYASFAFLEKYINLNDLIGFDKYTVRDMLIGLHHMFNNKESYKSYSQIINEELMEFESNKTNEINKCIYTKIDIILLGVIFNIT